MRAYKGSKTKVYSIPTRRLVRVSTGRIVEPDSPGNAYMERMVDEDGTIRDYIYPHHALTSKGVPHQGKAAAERVNVRLHQTDEVIGLADFDEAREQRASAQRVLIASLREQVFAAEKQLALIYGVEI